MFKVTFSFEDGSVVEAFANAGDNLLEVARSANVAIDAPCSGNGACGKCRVQLKSGELDSKKTLHISDEEYQETLKEYMDGNGVSNEEEMEKFSISNFVSKLDTIINEAVILNKVLKVVKDNAVEVKDKPLATATPTPSDNPE